MCLAVPGKIMTRGNDGRAEVDFGGVRRTVQMDLLPDARPGDYVIVHAGFAIQTMAAEDARETLKILQQGFSSERGAP